MTLGTVYYAYKVCKNTKVKINIDKFICWVQEQDSMGVESFLLHSLAYLNDNSVDERNINIIQQLKITLDQNVDMLSFNSAVGIKLLEFIAK